MKKILNLDSSFMIFLSNLTDIVILNVLCLICSIPIVTIGPSLTAMHYVTLKMARDEEIYVIKYFFKAWKDNFKKSVIIWIAYLIITVIFFFDYKILTVNGIDENKVFIIIIGVTYLFLSIAAMYVFPLLARFENTLVKTVKNAIFMSILHIFKTIIMAIIYLLPFVLLPLHYNVILAFLLIGLSGPAYLNSYIWKSIFKKYEPKEMVEEIVSDENFTISEM